MTNCWMKGDNFQYFSGYPSPATVGTWLYGSEPTVQKLWEKMSKLLDQPSRKAFIKDLRTCQRIAVSSSEVDLQKKLRIWEMYCHGRQLQFSVVWLQGMVTEVDDEADVILLDDGTGAAKVQGCSKIPFLAEKLKTGQYVMVIGHLSSTGAIPLLRAIKVQNLSHLAEVDKTWSMEVTDQILKVT